MSYADIERGINARAVLENPEFKRAFSEVKQAILEAVGLTAPGDKELREFLYQSVRTLPMLEQAMMRRMNNGAISAKEIAEAQSTEALGIY